MKVPGIETAKIEKDLAFSVAEYKQRLAACRRHMAKKNLDVLVVTTPENIFYLSGYQTPGYYTSQCLIVPMTGEPVHISRGIEETNVWMLSWIERSESYMDHTDPMELFAEILKKDGFAKGRIGIEKIGWFFSIANFERLKPLLPQADFQDGSMIVEACRVVKSEAEIAYIREAARCAEAGMRAALRTIRPGVTEANVAAEVQKAMTDMASEYPGLPNFICSGVRASQTHATWTKRVLQDGDPMFMELSGCIRRYSAGLLRSATVGKSPEKRKKIWDVSSRALDNMIAAIRPGRPLGEVWEAWVKTLEAAGHEGRFKRAGYSIGINFPPDWGEGYILCFKRGETRLLEPNMTFHIPSNVMIFGYAHTANSETVRVTETGAEVLTNFPRKLFDCPVDV